MNKEIPPFELLKVGVEAIQKMQEKEERWDKTFQEMYNGTSVPDYFSEPMHAICEMLEIAFNDPPGEYGSHISWWIWEANYGKVTQLADSVKDVKTNKHIPMRTLKDVYNYYKKYNFKAKKE